MSHSPIKLTQYSHGAGCGCKISPAILDSILSSAGRANAPFPGLLVGNEDRDDAAVFDNGDGTAIISTTDFFMPIADDPVIFGKIAATNAISDVYAMGGSPMMAIAILGWPVDKLPPEVAGLVIKGAQEVCLEAGIPLAGGHSIDAPEPIFGLAVTGKVKIEYLKKNGGAKSGDILFLTKPLGVGILSTAQKQNKLQQEHLTLATEVMIRLNSVGEQLAKISGVHAMTDVTGFGLAGHLIEMCSSSGTTGALRMENVPLIDSCVLDYINAGCVPGGTNRNYTSYGSSISMKDDKHKNIICDPQTSGGLLLAVDSDFATQVGEILAKEGLWSKPIGQMIKRTEYAVVIG